MKLKIDWEKAADSLAADVRRQNAEFAQMRLVFNAALEWHKWYCINPKGADYHAYTSAFAALANACARAARKAKRKR